MKTIRDISKEWDRMTDAQRRAFASQYDRVIPLSETRAPTKAELARLDRARRASQRRISVSMDQNLLQQADAFAKKHSISRSELIAQGLRSLMKRSKRAG